MFVDTAIIKIKAGDGGDGAVSFAAKICRGGRAGRRGRRPRRDIVFVADDGLNTLADFRYRKNMSPKTATGGPKNVLANPGFNHPRAARHFNLRQQNRPASCGHIFKRAFIAAKGGRGGWGNSHLPPRPVRCRVFQTRHSRRGAYSAAGAQTARGRRSGRFPNVGKSSLLSASGRGPKSLTTISPP